MKSIIWTWRNDTVLSTATGRTRMGIVIGYVWAKYDNNTGESFVVGYTWRLDQEDELHYVDGADSHEKAQLAVEAAYGEAP